MKFLKSLLLLILIISIVASTSVISACAVDIKELRYGDVNADGKIDITDVTVLQKHIAEIIIIDDDAIALSDVNRDGKNNIKDATAIQKYLVNLESESVTGERYSVSEEIESKDEDTLKITVGNTVFKAKFADNTSAEAFKEKLKAGPVTVNMHDYGNFEKVGALGFTLPRNDEQITTEAGDIILYQGNQITIYYDTNNWNFTRLGKIENVTKSELLAVLGKGNATVTFSI